MYKYRIGLAIIKSLADSEQGLDHRERFIRSQIKVFNEKSARSVFNPKYIGLGENGQDNILLTRTTLIITLYTQEILNTPGKAIRLLSQLLITSQDPDNLSDLLIKKKLFRTVKVSDSIDSDSTESDLNISNFSDSELIKALVDYVCNPHDFSADKRKALNRMKKIAIQSGLLKEGGNSNAL